MSHHLTVLMKKTWNVLAARDAMHYIATERESWDRDSFLQSGVTTLREVFLSVGASLEPSEGVALDLGCGVGRVSFALARLFGQVIAVDVSETMVAEGYRLKEVLGNQNVTFLCNNGLDLRMIESSTCDLAFSYIVLQHIPDKCVIMGCIGEMARVVKRHGHVLFQVPVYQQGHWSMIWRACQAMFRLVLVPMDRLGLVSPAAGAAFRGTRLLASDLDAAIKDNGLSVERSIRGQSTYRFCDDVIVYCRKEREG